MKTIFLGVLSFFYSWNVDAQIKNTAKLQISVSRNLPYDTLFIKNLIDTSQTITLLTLNNEKKIFTYGLDIDSANHGFFSIYFGGSLSSKNDTLFFQSIGLQLEIQIEDPFHLPDDINFRLTNVYNFESLYQNYTRYCKSTFDKYLQLNQTSTGLEKDQFYLATKLNFIKKHLNNPYSIDLFTVFILNPKAFAPYDDLMEFYSTTIENKIPDASTKKWVENKLHSLKKNNVEKGSVAPSFKAVSLDQKVINSDSFRGKNVLLTFWATWCIPCINELPLLKEIYSKYKKDGLAVISVSLDSDSLQLVKFIKEKKLNWIHIFSNKKMRNLYHINPIPAVFLIDEKGIIRFKSTTSVNQTNSMEKLEILLYRKFKH
jgi:peroxiredoxin